MNDLKRQRVEQCIERFRHGELTEEQLRRTLEDLARSEPRYQDLLYLQTGSTSLNSSAHGMAILLNGELSDGPADPEDWPYKTPLEAIRDGWRVLQFPNMALIMDESKAYGLGCEFILERWS